VRDTGPRGAAAADRSAAAGTGAGRRGPALGATSTALDGGAVADPEPGNPWATSKPTGGREGRTFVRPSSFSGRFGLRRRRASGGRKLSSGTGPPAYGRAARTGHLSAPGRSPKELPALRKRHRRPVP